MSVNEFQERIKEYTKALPKMKEKVAACALLLCISMVMMTTVSLAWLVRSAAPEIKGMTSTIAANGNLEIALASGSKTAPRESKVGDGDPKRNMQQRNITWGNLINLADAAYGLENIVLRPAQLNRRGLATSPLYGAEYDKDGRIKNLVSNFGYAVYNPDRGLFEISEESDYRGVRAISSTKTTYVNEPTDDLKAYDKAVETISALNLSAVNQYLALASDTHAEKMDSLTTLMGIYMTARLNAGQTDASDDFKNPAVKSSDIQNLLGMYELFLEAFKTESEAIAETLNLYCFLKSKIANPSAIATYKMTYTQDHILGTAETTRLTSAEIKALLLAEDVNENKGWTLITNIATFQSDYDKIVTSISELRELVAQGGTIRWKDEIAWRDETITTKITMTKIVERLVNVGTCTVHNSSNPTPTPVNSIGASNATNYVGKENEAIITNGILWNFERRTGARIRKENLTIKASIKRGIIEMKDQKISANVSTNASLDGDGIPYFDADFTKVKANSSGIFAVGVQSAKDTYGLAVDFWVRTNSQGNYLTLEDAVVREIRTVTDQGKDADGVLVDLYTVDVAVESDNGESTTVTYTVYKKTENGTDTWYSADSHALFELEEGVTPSLKKIQEEVVTGLAGENRVWDENTPGLVDNSTTQGSGSCYVFYADTPEDQARSLTLLKSMFVAFVDENGKLLAIGKMDTEAYWAENGRVTVPIVLDSSDSLSLGVDATGKEIRAITALEQNVSMMVSALVYLDGTHLSNEDVLASADIQGQLNIQFGTTVALYPVTDETLASQSMTIRATADNKSFDYDTVTGPMTTNVTLQVSGVDPSKVEAFFLCRINSTQGSREETVTFTKNADGSWNGAFSFTAPGSYVLRSVRIDGIERALSEPIEVTVKGFSVESLRWDVGSVSNYTIMTAAGSSSIGTTIKFASDDVQKMPKTVRGRFLREDGVAANIVYTYNPTNGLWEGTATFVTSGLYTLQYLVLDGKYTELAAEQQKTAKVNLGMKVAVYTESPLSFKFLPSEMTDLQKNLQMQVKIMDNTGAEMRAVRGTIKLYYRLEGSAIGGLDADLTWDEESGYYVGAFHPEQAGRYLFNTVSVTPKEATVSNSITLATTSPVFTLLPPNPPALYTENESKPLNKSYQYNTVGEASLSVDLDYSAGTTVYGVIQNLKTLEEVVVEGTSAHIKGNVYRWSFTIPTSGVPETQDGNWQLVAVKVSNYYDQEGNLIETPTYDEDGNKISGDEMIIDLTSRASAYTTKVVATVNVVFTENKSQDFGKDANGNVTGAFMTGYDISNLVVTFTDFEGVKIDGISEVKLNFVYDGNSSTYGGYTSASLTNALADFSIALTDSGDGITFKQTEKATIRYAGSYTTTFSYTMGSTTVELSGGTLPISAPKYTVSSVTPTVKITSISPTGTFDADMSGKGSGHASVTVPAFTGNEATVYFKCSREGDGSTCNPYRHNYARPSVTITLSGIGSATKASLDFGTDVQIYNGTTKTTGYSWTANGAVSRNIGYYRSNIAANDDKTPAGDLTATTLVLTYNSMTFNIVTSIKIHNPY